MVETLPTVTVLGTGIIGGPVARNLAAAGFPVRAWNRTVVHAQVLRDAGVEPSESAAEAVRGAGVIITVLPDAATTSQVLDQARSGIASGAIWVQLGTVGDDIDRLVDLAREVDVVLVDAPVQGTKAPAEKGALVVMASGPVEVRDRVTPLFDVIGARTCWVGEGTEASRLKLALTALVVALTQASGEMVALARGFGVDPDHVLDVIAGGPLDSGFLQAKMAAIVNDDYTTSFSVANAEKDTRLVLAAAARAGVRVDTVEAGQQRFARAAALGHEREDMAAAYHASF